MSVMSPIDPLEGHRYVELVYNEGHREYLNHFYNVAAMQEDYINPTVDGNLSWRSSSSYTSNSGEALEN